MTFSDSKRCDETQPWQCECTQHCRLVRKQEGNRRLLGYQCERCGDWEQIKRATLPKDYDDLPEHSAELRSSWCVKQKALVDDAEAAAAQKWKDDYERYLQTPKWKAKRDLVMRRACGICEACLEASATEVHHTTYRHVGNEPLFELRAVCGDCHESITKMDRERKIRGPR